MARPVRTMSVNCERKTLRQQPDIGAAVQIAPGQQLKQAALIGGHRCCSKKSPAEVGPRRG
jgi:hypothetical protein